MFAMPVAMSMTQLLATLKTAFLQELLLKNCPKIGHAHCAE